MSSTDTHEKNIKKRHDSVLTMQQTFTAQLVEIASTQLDIKADALKIAYALSLSQDLVHRTLKNGDQEIYIWSPEDRIHVNLHQYLNDFTVLGLDLLQSGSSPARLRADVLSILLAKIGRCAMHIDQFIDAPSYLLLFNDHTVDLRTNKIDDDIMNKYHFTSRLPFNYKIKPNPLYQEIAGRLIRDWSDDHKENGQFLLDVQRIVLEGHNKGRAIIIYGPGGNGKSAFKSLLSRSVGQKNVVDINLNQIENDFMLEFLTDSTKLLNGDELPANWRLTDSTSGKIKQISSGQPLTLNRKMKEPVTIKTNAVIVQATNSLPKWTEANAANKDRFVIFNWTTKNFRELKRNGEAPFDLDSLIENDNFIENWIHYVLEHTTYFKELHVPESVQGATSHHIDNSDTVRAFVNDLQEYGIIQHNEILPTSILYEAFKTWLVLENPSTKAMNRRSFVDRLKDILIEFGFTIATDKAHKALQTRIKTLEVSSFNSLQFSMLLKTKVDTLLEVDSRLNRTSYFINPLNQLKATTLETYKILLYDLEKLSDTEINNLELMRSLIVLLIDKKDTLLMSKFGDEIENLY